MSKIFNNKWAIVLLVLGAAFVIYSKVIAPLRAQSGSPVVEDEFATDIDSILLEDDEWDDASGEQERQLVTAQYDLKRIDTASIRWNESPSRDPFSSRSTLLDHHIEAVQNKVDSGPSMTISSMPNSTRALVTPVVSAIVNSSERSFAVINGKIFQNGDRVGGYRISDIQNTSIRLQHLASGRSMNLKVKK